MAPHDASRWYSPAVDPTTPMYRHVCADRFAQLLEARRLHFTRLDAYHRRGRDPMEGRHSAPMDRWFEAAAAGTVNARWAGTEAIKDNERRLSVRTAASCWTLDGRQPVEAWTKWGLRPGDVRLTTTLGALVASLGTPRLALGAIRYIDHASEWIPQHDDIVHLAFAKDRDHWGWEQEFRLALAPDPMLRDPELPAEGVDLSLRNFEWLTGVTLHPASSRAHQKSLAATLSRFGLPPTLAR